MTNVCFDNQQMPPTQNPVLMMVIYEILLKQSVYYSIHYSSIHWLVILNCKTFYSRVNFEYAISLQKHSITDSTVNMLFHYKLHQY